MKKMNMPTNSQRAEELERLKSQLRRHNPNNSKDFIAYSSDKGNKDVRAKDLSKLLLPKHPDAATPRTYNTLKDKGSYYTGMGEVPVSIRPGALDFKKYPSRGISA